MKGKEVWSMTKVIMTGSQDPGDQIDFSFLLSLFLPLSLFYICRFFFFFSLAALEMYAYLHSDQIHTRSICGTTAE